MAKIDCGDIGEEENYLLSPSLARMCHGVDVDGWMLVYLFMLAYS